MPFSTTKFFPPKLPLAAPGPGQLTLLRSLPQLRANPLQYIQEAVDRYGDIVHFKLGGMNAFLINHPSYIQQVLQEKNQNYTKDTVQYNSLSAVTGKGLLTSDGGEWLEHRRLMQPAFHRQQISNFGPSMIGAAEKMLQSWEKVAILGQVIDVDQAMMRLALEILGRALLGKDLSAGEMELTNSVLIALDHIVSQVKSPPGIPSFIPTPANRRFKAAMRILDQAVLEIIQDHQAKRETPQDDLLSRLVGLEGGDARPILNPRQLRDEVITILIAGHETVASALTWSCYLLSQNPPAEECMRQELNRVLKGRSPTVEDLPALEYTRHVFDETLRLFPPAWLITRKCIRADEIGSYRIPSGALVIIGVSAMHHHPGFWPTPERFDPDRFTPAGSAGRPHFAYLPFGGGPRLCIGKSFALTEAPLILAAIFQHYRLELATAPPIEVMPLVTLRPRGGMPMKVRSGGIQPA